MPSRFESRTGARYYPTDEPQPNITIITFAKKARNTLNRTMDFFGVCADRLCEGKTGPELRADIGTFVVGASC